MADVLGGGGRLEQSPDLLRAGERPADAPAPLLREQRAAGEPHAGHRSCRCHSSVLSSSTTMADQPFAVVDQQPHVELGPVKCAAGNASRPSCSAARATLSASIGSDLPRWRARPPPLPGPGDVERVDRIRLAALAGAPAHLGGQVQQASKEHGPGALWASTYLLSGR